MKPAESQITPFGLANAPVTSTSSSGSASHVLLVQHCSSSCSLVHHQPAAAVAAATKDRGRNPIVLVVATGISCQ
uniref:Uncharacterized protein n=1 Tax=Trichogramma kaykai TaxID=54128 RepID=A0ABD2XE49_9HYME